jgi:uncharacterized oxidoreductase
MRTSGNTILITGGGSGIGRGLAEHLHRNGNTVIIAGRQEATLNAVAAANPGMHALVLDIADVASIRSCVGDIVARFPGLNVLVNNAGIMKMEDIKSGSDDFDTIEETIAINLTGPMRLTSALLPHLQRQHRSTVMTVSSGLAFVPLAMTPTYCATKAALHSYSLSLRRQLKGTAVEVIEIIPPYVQTNLTGEHQASDPNAMPLAAFIDEVMLQLSTMTDATEIVVDRCKPLRFAAEDGQMDAMFDAVNSMFQ